MDAAYEARKRVGLENLEIRVSAMLALIVICFLFCNILVSRTEKSERFKFVKKKIYYNHKKKVFPTIYM
jgi:hypothetical protein